MPKKICYSDTQKKAVEAFNYIIKIRQSIFDSVH